MNNELNTWLKRGFFFHFNSHKLFYIEEGQGDCLLIFHGYPYNGYDFVHLLPKLSKQFRVIIPDMLGMGFSDKPEDHIYSFEEMADIYASLLKSLNIKRVHILAHDLGNSVVQELIARDKEKKNAFSITSIAFLNGGLFVDVYKPRFIQILLSKSPAPVGRLFSSIMTKKMVSKATSEVFGPETKPTNALLDCFWDILNYNNGKSIAYLLGRLVFQKEKFQQRWISTMQQTTIPMCFINGPADPNSGIHMANRYKELIPNANVKMLPAHIGHWPQIEAPELVLEAYGQFVSDYAARG